MTLHINDAGTWRQIREVWVNDSGTWRQIQEVFVNDNGTWRSVFVADVISISNVTVFHQAFDPSDATATYRLESDGDIMRTVGSTPTDLGDWITPKINMSLYEVRATLNSGTNPSGSALNTWLPLSLTRSWTQTQTDLGSSTCQLTIEIRRASNGQVVDSALVTITATVS